MRPKLYQPFLLPVRRSLWLMWAVIAVLVLFIGSQNPEPNDPLGLLLLGFGLAGPGLLAVLGLASPAYWSRLIDPELDAGVVRTHLYLLAGLGVAGAVMMGVALHRLV